MNKVEQCSSPVGYSYLSILPDDNPDIFAAGLLAWHYHFCSLILSSMAMTIFFPIDSFKSVMDYLMEG